MRTLKQLQANLKDGYKIRKFGYRITGAETCVVDKQGNKVAYQVTTVKAFIERCIEKGLVKEEACK